MSEADFKDLTAAEIFGKMNRTQNTLMEVILEYYSLNEIEKKVYADYKKVIDFSFFPNAALWIKLLKKKEYVDKVLELLELLCEKDKFDGD